MTLPTVATNAAAQAWTCPFCGLLCDEFELAADGLGLRGSTCARAGAALRAHADGFGATGGAAVDAMVDGRAVTRAAAIAAAARRLAAWRQPLFGGLGTDVAGARALYRLAVRTGAICDAADGAALMHALRPLQDRGQYTTTLAELRARADLVVCVGTSASARHPEFFRRAGLLDDAGPRRRVVFLGAAPEPGLAWPAGVAVDAVAGTGDGFADLQQLGALVSTGGARIGAAPALAALAEALLAARYAVLVWEPATLPAAGALWAEALNRLVLALNRRTRAGSLALGGGDGAATVNQVFAWLSGLPLRSRAGPDGLEHEPVRFDAARLVADGAVDGVLWISSFDLARLPPPGLPAIVLGPPAMAPRLADRAEGPPPVFLPVATPGLNATGHLFRTDGIVLVPLAAPRATTLAGVGDVLRAIEAATDAADDGAVEPAP